jgi:hypothetical protein
MVLTMGYTIVSPTAVTRYAPPIPSQFTFGHGYSGGNWVSLINSIKQYCQGKYLELHMKKVKSVSAPVVHLDFTSMYPT